MEWKDGYITEIEYVHGVYKDLSPSALNFILLLQSLEPLALEDGFSYCDLGCGQGESVNLFAACHPEGRFHAVDFNPVHIAGARALAGEAKLGNVSFWEASFADLDTLPLPEFDFIVLHGIYTWVGDENRRRIREFLQTKLKPGGVVYLSYNSLPGWSAHAPLRKLLASYADTLPGPLEQRVERSLEFVERLKSAHASIFEGSHSTADFFDYICTLPRNYLAHEFFNWDWTLFYHADLVRELAPAKLVFAGSANLAENQDMLRFPVEQQQLLDGISDRVLRETVKDFAAAPLLRRDLFTQGRPRIAPARQLEHFGHCRFALVVPQAKLERKAHFPIGEVLLERELYDPILSALELRPHSLEELLQRQEIAPLGVDRVREALMVLLSAEYAMVAGEPQLYTVMTTRRLNDALLGQRPDSLEKLSLASPVLRSAIKVDWMERLLLRCEMDKHPDPQSSVWAKMEKLQHKFSKDGELLLSKEENRAELERQIACFRNYKLPLLRQLGIL